MASAFTNDGSPPAFVTAVIGALGGSLTSSVGNRTKLFLFIIVLT